MRGRRAICVSRDDGVRRVVGEALATGKLSVEHVEHLDLVPRDTADIAVIVVDRATRQAAGEALCALTAPVIIVGDDLDDDVLITLMLDQPVSHLVEDPCDRTLGVTSEKLATGDLFGLEKYLAPGSRVGERVIRSEADRRHAIDEVCSWAEAIGARRPVIHRMTSVIDELLMNALRSADRPGRAVLRWASDDTTIAISVGDGHGALCQRDVIDHVRRARHERGRPQPLSESEGAGLGLYLVLANVASLIVNVAPGEQTEVVCLFDLAKPTRKGAVSSGVRSLHVFAAPEADALTRTP